MSKQLNRLFGGVVAVFAWSWNTIKALPGVYYVGHGVATILGLYRLDRWLTRRDAAENLLLACELQKVPELADAGRRLEESAKRALR